MRVTSLAGLVVAVLFGIGAVAGVSALLSNNAASEVGARVDVVDVVVAAKPLEFGTDLTPNALKTVKWPANALPEGSFQTIEDVIGSDRRVALRAIAVEEPVLKEKISGFGGRASLSQIIDEGYRAVAVRVTDVSGAGGFVLPGDRVDVVSTISPTSNRLDTVTNILLENIRVLAIDQEADESTSGAVVAKAATLEVLPEDAQKLALASNIGTLSLSLRNTLFETETARARNKPITYKDLGPDTPSPEPVAAVRRSVPTSHVMTVTRGVDATRETVPRERATANRSSATRQPVSSGGPVSSAGAGSASASPPAALPVALTTASKLSAPVGDEAAPDAAPETLAAAGADGE